MSVHKFERPELDEQICTALEQLHEAESALKYLGEQHHNIKRVYDAAHMFISPAAAQMLIGDLDDLQEQVGLAREAVEHWRDILDVLKKRNA